MYPPNTSFVAHQNWLQSHYNSPWILASILLLRKERVATSNWDHIEYYRFIAGLAQYNPNHRYQTILKNIGIFCVGILLLTLQLLKYEDEEEEEKN